MAPLKDARLHLPPVLSESETPQVKRFRIIPTTQSSYLDLLPDEILSAILVEAVQGLHRPADFLNLLLSSKRVCQLALQPCVLRVLSSSAMKVSAASWSESSCHFLAKCAQAGNSTASYSLGMVSITGCPRLI
jgi:hypothetical protein